MLSPSIWNINSHTGGILGFDSADLRARLSIHPDDVARAALALCLATEAATVAAMQQDPAQ